MITRHLLLVFTLIFGSISCLTVDIMIQPEIIEIGNELLVTCTIVGDPLDKGFKTLLKCPFHDKQSICIINCDSTDICSSTSCNRKMVGSQSFQCDLSESPTRLSYSYRFPSITDSIVRNRKQLPFTCSFRGQEAKGLANIISSPSEKNPIEQNPIKRTIPTTRSLPDMNPNNNNINNNNDIIDSDNNLIRIRDLVLLGIISSLLISFLLNIWCCVKSCIRSAKIRAKNRKLKSKQLVQEYNTNEENNEINSQYYSRDYIERARSHPTLANTERSIPARFGSSTLNQPNAFLMNKQKYRNSIQNSTVLDEEDMNNGSNHSLLNSLYGQMVLAPIQYFDPSIIPSLTQLSQPYPIPMQVNSDHERFDNLSNQEIPERQDTSLCHSLPKKPE